VRILLAAAVLGSALTFAGASQAAAGRSGASLATLTIVTVPRLAGVRFSLDGATFATGRRGIARIETTHGDHVLRILDRRVVAPGLRSTFVRWSDSRYTATRTIAIGRNTRLEAGFAQSVLVRFAFADGAGRPVVGRVTRITLANTLGSRVSFQPEWPQWLPAVSVARRFTGLEPTLVQYSLERALVDGSNVVNESQQRFYPARTRRVTARLLLYSARVSVRDFVFGTASGSRIVLVFPNGTRASYPLHGGAVRLSSLPRGTYQVAVDAAGYVPAVSLALSRNQALSVKVVSYWDMLLFVVLALGTVSALILVPRPYLRLRLRSLGTGRTPTLDDLGPPKPLSGARRQLIHRYMTDRSTRAGRNGSGTSAPAPCLPVPAPSLPAPAAHQAATAPPPDRRPALRDMVVRLRDVARERLAVCSRPWTGRGLRTRLRPTRDDEAADAVLTGERIELIHVYMGEQAASRGALAPSRAQQETAPASASADGAATAQATLGPLRQRLGAWGRRLRAATTGEAGQQASAPVEPEATPPGVAVAPNASRTGRPAPRTPASRKRPVPDAAPGPGKPKPKPKPKRTQATRKRAVTAGGKGKTAAKRRSPVKEGKAQTAKAKPEPAAKQPSARAAKATGHTLDESLVGTGGSGPVSEDLALLRPDLAAAIEALHEELRRARGFSEPDGRAKNARWVRR